MSEEVIKCHCNVCGHQTNHDLIARRVVKDSEEIDESISFWWETTSEFLQCRGCESTCLKDITEDASGDIETRFYPPVSSRRWPKWLWKLPQPIAELTREVYKAIFNDSHRLVLMGARAIVEMLMLKEIGDVGTFRTKLQELENRGFISTRGRETLAVALDAGNAAAHRGYRAGVEDIEAIMDIIENLLESVYHLEKIAAQIKDHTPARQNIKKEK
jgi:hypothetical protein